MVVVAPMFTPPAEGILLQTPSTKLLVNDHELGTATLYITENDVVWGGGVMPSGIGAPSVTLLYPNISLHAVQREPSPALYMVLNYELRLPEIPQQPESGDANEDDDFDADDHPITQLRFVPENENDLQAMYSAMSQGQSLHPDPADEVDDDEPYMDGEEIDEDEEFEDAEESNMTAEDAAARLRQMRLENSNGAQHYNGESEDADIAED